MTPQSLSIADLKAVIDYISELPAPPDKIIHVKILCRNELMNRIKSITEPKTEEK